MNLRDFDLNLLTIFDAVIRNGSVTGAAEQLNMAPASVSQAISRLRQKSEDPLFVRDGRGIRPTNHALTMHQQIKVGLKAIERGLESGKLFIPEESTRTFVIAGEQYIDLLLFPALLMHIKTLAPSVSIELIAEQDSVSSMSSLLSERKADLFLSTESTEHQSIDQEWLRDFESMVVCAGNHPRVQGSITEQQYFDEEHIIMKTRRLNERFLSRLAQRPLPARKVVHQSLSVLNILAVAARTEYLFICPHIIVKPWQEKLNLQIIEPPFAMNPAPIYMSMHASKLNDPGILWLKEQLKIVMNYPTMQF